ncbi:MAG: hypothetical protein FD122_3743 [Stygiobacter sp.]|nr:MAG: hypothetical protein FD122_3743 [Stygiobacter sp.]
MLPNNIFERKQYTSKGYYSILNNVGEYISVTTTKVEEPYTLV